jgi:HEAT repeat protein
MRPSLLIGACLLLAGCNGKSTAEWVAQLRDRDSTQRLHAIQALGENRTDAEIVVPALAQTMQDADAFVRRDTARALARFGQAASAAVPALRLACRDRNQHVRQAATEALRQVAPDLAGEAGKR